MYKVTIVQPNGESNTSMMEKDPDYKFLQQSVGGYIELIGSWTNDNVRSDVYVNEEGYLKKLTKNEAWPKICSDRKYIVRAPLALWGPIVIVDGPDTEDDDEEEDDSYEPSWAY